MYKNKVLKENMMQTDGNHFNSTYLNCLGCRIVQCDYKHFRKSRYKVITMQGNENRYCRENKYVNISTICIFFEDCHVKMRFCRILSVSNPDNEMSGAISVFITCSGFYLG